MYAFIVIVVLVLTAVGYRFFTRKRVMSPEQFVEAVRQRILSHHPNIKVVSANGFDWVMEIDGRPENLYLHNTYSLYCQQPALFSEVVDYFLNAMSSIDDPSDITWEEAKPRLFPCLKSQEYFVDNRKIPGGAEMIDNLVSFDYVKDLKIIIAIDSETSMSFVNRKQFEIWGVSNQTLLDTSIQNLGKLTAEHWAEATRMAKESGLFAFTTHDGYDASRILLPDFYERASRALGCEKILVGIPNRDFIAAIPDNAPWKEKFCKQVQSDAESYDHLVTSEIIALP